MALVISVFLCLNLCITACITCVLLADFFAIFLHFEYSISIFLHKQQKWHRAFIYATFVKFSMIEI